MITIYRPANGELMWQTIVFMLPCLAVVVLVNIYGSRTIATLQNVTMSLHVLALIAIVGRLNSGHARLFNANGVQAILGVLSPHIPVKRGLLRVENTEWPSTALAVLAGQTNANYSLFCEYNGNL